MLWIILFLSVIFLVYFSNRSKKGNENSQLDKEYSDLIATKSYVSEIRQNKRLPIIRTAVYLKTNEEAYLEDDYTELYETRAVRVSNRAYLGGRLAKGVYGGYSSGESRSFDELRKIDSGKLVLTNERIIFVASTNTRTIDIKKIVSFERFGNDGIKISIEGRNKSEIYSGVDKSLLWSTVFNIIQEYKLYDNTERILNAEQLDELRQAEEFFSSKERELKEKLSVQFIYQAKDAKGETKEGIIGALDENEAAKKLQDQNLIVISVKRKG